MDGPTEEARGRGPSQDRAEEGDHAERRNSGGGGNEAKNDEQEDEGRDRPPLYKRPIFWIVIAVVAAVLLVGGTLYYLNSRKYESTDDAFIDAHVVRIAAETSGTLRQVAQLDNRHVSKGQLLAEIEPDQPAATRNQALAAIAAAEAQIRQAQAQVVVAGATLQQASANALAPLAEAKRAEADYARYRNLKQIDPLAAAPTQLDQARAQSAAAAGQATAARKQVETARANVTAAEQQVDAARAQRQAAQAQLEKANVEVSYTTIRAPIGGQLVHREVAEGSYVAPGEQLMAIVPDDMWVTANFKETQLARMRPGQPVSIKIDAFPDRKFAGHVDSIQQAAGQAFQILPPQNATGNYVKVVQRVPVRIRFDEKVWTRLPIGPGMSVKPRVTVRP